MLSLKNSLKVLECLVTGRNPRYEFSSATVSKCFQELAKHGLIEMQHHKYAPTERGKNIIVQLTGGPVN